MHRSATDLAALTHAAAEAAQRAGALLREGFGGLQRSTSKDGRHNLVTEYDVRVEHLLHGLLSAIEPSSEFLGEEGGMRTSADPQDTSGTLTWIVDPLDGTVNFAHGIPIFCVSIGAAINGHVVAGVIYNPMLDELFTAYHGGGALLNGTAIGVSATTALDDSILVTGFPYNVESNPRRCIDQFAALAGKGLPLRRLGSAALDLAYTAAGRFDGFWEVELQPWDMAAGICLLREAGGTVTQYDGVEMHLQASSIVATNGHIHQELLATLHQAEHS